MPHVTDIRATFDSYPGVEIPAEVSEIGSEPTESTRTYPVKLLLTPPPGVAILPGMAGRVRGKPGRIAGQFKGVVIPVAAAFSPDGATGSFVWVVKEPGGTVHRQPVTLGEPVVGGISVTSGLTPGTLVAAAGVHTLREGQTVRLLADGGGREAAGTRHSQPHLYALHRPPRGVGRDCGFLLPWPAGGARFHHQGGGGLDGLSPATPIEVERDVTDRIESKLQELKQVDYLESSSQEGLSTIKVVIKPRYSSEQIPQVWDELRRKVGDVAPQLPKGAGPSSVGDDFGDVYGLLLAVTGDGYSRRYPSGTPPTSRRS